MKKQLLGFILTLFIINLATQMKSKNNCFRNLNIKLEVVASGKKITKKSQKISFFGFSNLDF